MKNFELAKQLINQVACVDEITTVSGITVDEAEQLIRESDLTDINKWWAGLHMHQRDFYLEDRWAMAAAALRFGKTGNW